VSVCSSRLSSVHCDCSSIAVISWPQLSLALSILSTGQFCPKVKQSIITPLLKKPSLDKENVSNYRPIFNLSTISKIIERVVKSRLTDHLTQNTLFNPLQSAYRKFHSTETVLNSVTTWSPYPCSWSTACHLPLSAWFICCFWYHWPYHSVGSLVSVVWSSWHCTYLV